MPRDYLNRIVLLADLHSLNPSKLEYFMSCVFVAEPVESVGICPIGQKSIRQVLLADMLLRIQRFGAEEDVVIGACICREQFL